jgi:hypothetical protein
MPRSMRSLAMRLPMVSFASIVPSLHEGLRFHCQAG